MKKNFLLLLASTFFMFSASGQVFSTITENAFNINKLDSLDSKISALLSDYKLIMIGEMHGTNEPAKFVIGLTRLLSSAGDSIQVGLEIPSEQMTEYIKHPSYSTIYSSDFFAKKSNDGRASIAWAEIIENCTTNPKVKIFFYDTNKGDCENADLRDSLMYLKIKNNINQHSSWKTITLSGNIHNMLLPYKEKNKMAYYLRADTELNISDKICSLNHYYQGGTMLNNTGNGLELHKINYSASEYSKAVDYENYLLILPINTNDRYTGIYFTRSVTAARMVTNK